MARIARPKNKRLSLFYTWNIKTTRRTRSHGQNATYEKDKETACQKYLARTLPFFSQNTARENVKRSPNTDTALPRHTYSNTSIRLRNAGYRVPNGQKKKRNSRIRTTFFLKGHYALYRPGHTPFFAKTTFRTVEGSYAKGVPNGYSFTWTAGVNRHESNNAVIVNAEHTGPITSRPLSLTPTAYFDDRSRLNKSRGSLTFTTTTSSGLLYKTIATSKPAFRSSTKIKSHLEQYYPLLHFPLKAYPIAVFFLPREREDGKN